MESMFFEESLERIFKDNIYKIVLSNLNKNANEEYKKINIDRVLIKNKEQYQLSKYTQKQVFHENIEPENLFESICSLSKSYKQLNIFSEEADYEIKFNKKRDYIINKSQKTHTEPRFLTKSNNRKKEYILKEGEDIPVFRELGIFTSDFKIVNTMYDKFKQINRFTQILDDMLKDYTKDDIHIIDFGCGKSYLTFVVYHYLTKVKNIKANILGLDLKADVIEKCNILARKYQYDGLKFAVGDINGYKADFEVDMVMTLHACDTATDYALYNAIEWNASMIMSVPCCQHEVNKQIQSDNLSGLMKYGIIKERFSALLTDTVRGLLLEACGYRTDIMEFIDIENSPKNILIRARKRNISSEKRKKSYDEAKRLCEEFLVEPTLIKMLKNKT